MFLQELSSKNDSLQAELEIAIEATCTVTYNVRTFILRMHLKISNNFCLQQHNIAAFIIM